MDNLYNNYIAKSYSLSMQTYILINQLYSQLNENPKTNEKPKIHDNYYQTPFFLTKKRNLPLFQIKSLNEGKIIRTIKNKKIVYCKVSNSFSLLNNPEKGKNRIISLNEKKNLNKHNTAEKNFKLKGKRGSKYRGVSKNGNQWQVLIMIDKKKRYIGNYKTEEEATSTYDIVAIQNHGNKAKTNFYYSSDEILQIQKMKKINFWEN